MKIAIACDHGAFDLKQKVAAHLGAKGYEVVDFGTHSKDSCDYPDFAGPAARAVASGACEKGILLCTTGIGVSITANKVKGIRAVCCSDAKTAGLIREHNNAQIIALSALMTTTMQRMREVIAYAKEVLEKTPEMLPVLKEAGVVDSGGQGLLEVLNGAYDAFLGKEINYSAINSAPATTMVKPGAQAQADIKFGYCTEFIIMTEKEFTEQDEVGFKAYLESIGDSIVCVADEDVVKVHVHTNDPGLAIQKALTFGQLSRMKIDNMREEHQEKLIKDAEKLAELAHAGVVAGEVLASIRKNDDKIEALAKENASLRKQLEEEKASSRELVEYSIQETRKKVLEENASDIQNGRIIKAVFPYNDLTQKVNELVQEARKRTQERKKQEERARALASQRARSRSRDDDYSR